MTTLNNFSILNHINRVKGSIDAIDLVQTQVDNIQTLFTENTNNICFVGIGKPSFAISKVVYTANSYGLHWKKLDSSLAMHGNLGILEPTDLIIFVSKSGTTFETIELCEYIRDDYTTLAISSVDNSPLVKLCNHKLIIPIEDEGSMFGYAPMISTTMYLMIMHALLNIAVISAGVTYEQYAKNHPGGGIGKEITQQGGRITQRKENDDDG